MGIPESAPPSRGAIGAADQDLSDAEFAELDALLADIPEPLEPLDVVMLDGFLCGVIVQPMLLEPDAWLPYVFDAGGHRWGEAQPGPEQQRARALILRRHTALNRAIAEFGSFEPFILEPEAEGSAGDEEHAESAVGEPAATSQNEAEPATPVDLVGEALLPWVAGFEQAIHLLPALVELDDPEVATALERLFRFLPDEAQAQAALVARGQPLESIEAAIAEVVECVAELYELTLPLRYKVEAVRRTTPKVGRNEPCPCGSGRKFKQCHGAAAPA